MTYDSGLNLKDNSFFRKVVRFIVKFLVTALCNFFIGNSRSSACEPLELYQHLEGKRTLVGQYFGMESWENQA